MRWLQRTGRVEGDPEGWSGGVFYARRQEFGCYVDDALKPYLTTGAVRHIHGAVVDAVRGAFGWRLGTDAGQAFDADLLIIATTHPKPGLPPELQPIAGDVRLVRDGLADDALQNVAPGDRILIVGSGLTAADLVASLDLRGHEGKITMISRRGLRSRSHPREPLPAEGDFVTAPSTSATHLLSRIRSAVRHAEATGRGWHPVFDALRIQGGEIWSALTPEARRRLVRHLRPFWDAHRFRIAPQIDAVLDRKLKDGSLELVKGRIIRAFSKPSGLEIAWRNRSATIAEGGFDNVLVATGPAHGDVLEAQSYLKALAQKGFVALDATGLGLMTSRTGRAIGASGQAEPTLFVAGPLARGTFGELMGLPQVSFYAEFIAEKVLKSVVEERDDIPLDRAAGG